MFNLLCMDLHRLFKTRSFFMTLGVMAALIVLVNLMAVTMSDPEFLDAMEAGGAEISQYDRQEGELIRGMSQLQLAYEVFSSGFLLLVTGIGLSVFFGQDYTCGFVKNIWSAQPVRWLCVLEKAAFAGLYSALLTALAVALALLSPACMGFSARPDPLPDILLYAFLLWLPNWAFGLMALFMVLLSRHSTLGILMSLASGLGLTAALSQILPHLLHLPYPSPYFLSSVVRSQCLPRPYPPQIQTVVLCSAGWGLAYLLCSLFTAEKQDI